MEIDEDKRKLYNSIKEKLINTYKNPFNPVFWVRDPNLDFIVKCFGKDKIYKIITNGDRLRINKIKEYWKNKILWSGEVDLYFVYIDKDFSKIVKEEKVL